ncbi:LCP family protein [Georgenia sp. MJ173]|uniref:LCP family protein n=1 Tax=Georgenia sunbinii TaxID=3117728 RepID=UPI002F26A693
MTEPEPGGSRMVKVAFFVALSFILLLGGGAMGGLFYLQSRLDANIERFPDPFAALAERPAPAPRTAADDDGAAARSPVTFLVLGSDSRISAGEPEEWELGAQRTDAIMLVQLSGDRKSVTAMSIPRDSWVEIPGHGHHKLNAAFSFGGPALTVATLESLTGVRIDHVAIADFISFAAMTDELGGVEIRLAQPLQVGDTVLEPGERVLDGEQALQYVRERYTLPGGDFDRVQRQQNWMRSILDATISRDVLTDPAQLWAVLESFSQSLGVEETLTIGEMRNLAFSARELRKNGLSFITAPYEGTGWSPDGRQSIVILDDAPFAAVSAAFADGTIHEFLAANPDVAPRLGAMTG